MQQLGVFLMQTFSQASPAIAEALFANIAAQLPQMYAHMPGVEMSPDGDWIGICSNHLGLVFNSVYGTRFSRDRLDRQIAAVLSFYAARNALPMAWGITPGCQPANLSNALETRGFKRLQRAIGMFIDLEQVDSVSAPDRLHQLIQVSNRQQLDQWLIPLRQGFDFSAAMMDGFSEMFERQGFGDRLPWRLLVGMVEDQPVCCARLFFAAGVAGLYHVATVPGARQQGFGTEITLAAIQMAKALGYPTVVLIASSAGYSLYHRLGFRDCGSAEVYLSPS
jgi:ribosomal protein S18 acetylase RimI-like enzyme